MFKLIRDDLLHRQIFSLFFFFFKGGTWPDVICNEAPGRHWQTAIRAERMEHIILPPTNDYLHVLILFSSSCSSMILCTRCFMRSRQGLRRLFPTWFHANFFSAKIFVSPSLASYWRKRTGQSQRAGSHVIGLYYIVDFLITIYSCRYFVNDSI